jgi:hypothetical protein
MRLRGPPESYSDDSSVELAMRLTGGRGMLVELRREGRAMFVCCFCVSGASLVPDSSPRRLLDWETAGEGRPDGCDCCCAYAKSAGLCTERREWSEFPRVSRATGGPRVLSMPWPLREAGGLLNAGSWPVAMECGEKHEGEFPEDVE